MSGSVNKVILIGNLCADPEIRSFANGGKIANIRLATNERWKSRDGEQKERAEYHSVVIQGDGLVGIAERFLKKGSKIYAEGKLQTRKWQDQSGNDRYSTEVVVGFGGSLTMLDGPSGGGERRDRGVSQGGGSTNGRESNTWNNPPDTQGSWGANDLDDDVPF